MFLFPLPHWGLAELHAFHEYSWYIAKHRILTFATLKTSKKFLSEQSCSKKGGTGIGKRLSMGWGEEETEEENGFMCKAGGEGVASVN